MFKFATAAAVSAVQANEAEFVSSVIPKIRGTAHECMERKAFESIKSLTKHLKESFATAGLTFTHYHTQLSQVKMSSVESVQEYASRVRRLVSKTKAALSNEFGEENMNSYTPIVTAEGLNGFLRGLRPDIAIRVAIRRPKTL